MSIIDAEAPPTPGQEQPVPLLLILLLGFMGCVAFCWIPITTVWRSGTFGDTDDAMRMVQVRDWMAGQGWYDLRALRLDPPAGVLMHWSRVVDVPLAGLIRLFGVFADQETAERLARIVFPLSMQALLLVGTSLCGRLLAGSFGGIVAVLLTIASGMGFIQFVPGRIDHHAPQIVLLVFMVYACLCGLDPQRPRMAAVAGLCAALSLAIAIENLPFIFVLMAIYPVAWALQGAPMRGAMVWMGAGFAASLLLAFALFQSPALWTTSACDALSAVHIRAALSGAVATALLAILDRWRKPGLRARLLACGLIGLFAATPLWLDRQCFLDPFNGLDPLVRELWLSGVREARNIPALLGEHPGDLGVWVMPWALGACAIAVAVFVEQGLARTRFLALLALTLAGCATAAYMSRAISSVTPLALLGGVWTVTRARNLCGKEPLRAILVLSATLPPFTVIGWAVAVPLADRPAKQAQYATAARCAEKSAFGPLRSLPAARILTLIDLSPMLLAHTHHSVIAGPYHRNNKGNRLMYDAFLASPETAQDMLRAADLRYVVLCDPANTAKDLIHMAPEGLAAAIAGEKPIVWLRRIEAVTPLRLYEVVQGP